MVQVLGCKVLLVVLCGGRLQEKYRYLFNQVADHNNCCTRYCLKVWGLVRVDCAGPFGIEVGKNESLLDLLNIRYSHCIM